MKCIYKYSGFAPFDIVFTFFRVKKRCRRKVCAGSTPFLSSILLSFSRVDRSNITRNLFCIGVGLYVSQNKKIPTAAYFHFLLSKGKKFGIFLREKIVQSLRKSSNFAELGHSLSDGTETVLHF